MDLQNISITSVQKLLTANAMLWCIYANINSYLIICKLPLDWSIFIGEKKNDWKKTRLQQLDYARAEHPATNFIHFHLFHAFTHQATPNVYLWPQGVEVKLFAKDYPKKRTAFTRLQTITEKIQRTEPNNDRTSGYIKNLWGFSDCAHIEGMKGCKLICDTIFLTKTRKTLSLAMKTQ